MNNRAAPATTAVKSETECPSLPLLKQTEYTATDSILVGATGLSFGDLRVGPLGELANEVGRVRAPARAAGPNQGCAIADRGCD
jgi:hypothetical protein